MTARDDLATLICDNHGDSPNELADKVIAAGWRPPGRVIENPYELRHLPEGSIVFREAPDTADRQLWWADRWDEETENDWWSCPDGDCWYFRDIPLPVTVLHEPEEADRG